MKKSYYLLPIFILSLLSLAVSCSSEELSENDDIQEFDRGSVMENYANNIIIPRYNDFKSELDKLKTEVLEFTQNPSTETHTSLSNQWLEAYKAWQYVEMFNIGKAEEIMYSNTMNTYPVNQERTIDNINSEKIDLSDPNDWACQGFPGLDFLIHGVAENLENILNLYNSDTKYGDYLIVVISNMSTNTNNVVDDWSSYKSEFISSTNNTATSAFNMLTNDFVYYFEKGLRTNKIGIPAGVFSNNPLDTKIEAYFASKNSFKDVSKELITEALEAVKLMFSGTSKTGSVGPSYKSYLNYIKNINNNGVDIGSEVMSKINTSNDRINDLDKNFINQINNDNTKMLATFDALQKIVVNLKTDMLSLFNIAVDYQDADGD
ncbi:MAG: peptidase M75 superfamily protein [Flavobacteriaceae bacterium]|nr:peptidase M75 superfamily protein [Flavobacteriaceae bacterium]